MSVKFDKGKKTKKEWKKRVKYRQIMSVSLGLDLSLTFRVVGESGAYSAQRPRDEDDVVNAGHVVTEELCAVTVGLLHT